MKKLIFLFMPSVLILSHCGSSTPTFSALKKPMAIALSSDETIYKNQPTQLAYVADQFTQSIVVIDTDRQEFVDTADDDDFDFSPIPVGGEPVAVAVDNTTTPHRVFVADQLNHRIIAYQLGTIDQGKDLIPYTPDSLGGSLTGISSRPLFKNSGAASSPALTNIQVDVDKAKNESWFLKYKNDSFYEVTGTVSGKQTSVAVEGETYTSDNGEISFYISAGGEKTTNDDEFFFGTALVRPLVLAATPVDMLIKDTKLYILTKDDPSIMIYDLENSNLSTVLLPDPTAVPSKMAIDGSYIYISNLASSTFFRFNTSSLGMTSIPTGLSQNIRSIGKRDNHVFLILDSTNQMAIWNLDTDSVEETLSFNNSGNAFFIADVPGLTLGIIPNMAGDADVVDISTLEKFDTDLSDKSVFVDPEFFDVAPTSNPELISVNTVSSLTLTETWQMTFEGIVSGIVDVSGTFSSDTLTTSAVDFIAAGVQEGDLVISQGEEFEVESVDSATTLTLTTTPSFSGSHHFDIRSNGTYIVVGSISGVQEKRVKPGITYTSDSGQISLKTSPSFDKPETRGDFFTFGTVNEIDPIETGNQAVASGGIFFERISDDKPVAYILEQTTGQIAIIDMTNYDVDKTL